MMTQRLRVIGYDDDIDDDDDGDNGNGEDKDNASKKPGSTAGWLVVSQRG